MSKCDFSNQSIEKIQEMVADLLNDAKTIDEVLGPVKDYLTKTYSMSELTKDNNSESDTVTNIIYELALDYECMDANGNVATKDDIFNFLYSDVIGNNYIGGAKKENGQGVLKNIITVDCQMKGERTQREFAEAIASCRTIFQKKLKDYGAAWRIMRPSSITDQILIKANRIRTLETTGTAMVDEGIQPEFIGIVNYGVVGLIQLERGAADVVDMTVEEASELYETYITKTTNLMLAKNHDYGEAWRLMRISSYTDMILSKLQRTKQIEDNDGKTLISEGIDANYMDMINYALFALIKLSYGEQR